MKKWGLVTPFCLFFSHSLVWQRLLCPYSTRSSLFQRSFIQIGLDGIALLDLDWVNHSQNQLVVHLATQFDNTIWANICPFLSILVHSCPFLSILDHSCQFLWNNKKNMFRTTFALDATEKNLVTVYSKMTNLLRKRTRNTDKLRCTLSFKLSESKEHFHM